VRRGATLVEMAALIAIGAIVLAGAGEALVQLRRLAGTESGNGLRAEQACLRLRRDLAGGEAAWQDGALRIARPGGTVLWRVEDGQLLRDGRLQVAVTAFAAGEGGVELTPRGLPPRRIGGGGR